MLAVPDSTGKTPGETQAQEQSDTSGLIAVTESPPGSE